MEKQNTPVSKSVCYNSRERLLLRGGSFSFYLPVLVGHVSAKFLLVDVYGAVASVLMDASAKLGFVKRRLAALEVAVAAKAVVVHKFSRFGGTKSVLPTTIIANRLFGNVSNRHFIRERPSVYLGRSYPLTRFSAI